MILILKIFRIFATSRIHKGKPTACQNYVAGFFCACAIIIFGSAFSGKSYDLLPLWVCDNGKGWAVLLSSPAYHLNLSVMSHTEKDNCATCAQKPITAESIIKEIISWDDPENIREDLHEMMLAFFMHYESPTEEFKGRIYCTYTTLYNALKQIETLNPRRAKS